MVWIHCDVTLKVQRVQSSQLIDHGSAKIIKLKTLCRAGRPSRAASRGFAGMSNALCSISMNATEERLNLRGRADGSCESRR